MFLHQKKKVRCTLFCSYCIAKCLVLLLRWIWVRLRTGLVVW